MTRKSSLLVIFLTVFIDLIGFGIVLQMMALYSKEYGASGLIAGCIVASYSLMQFIFAPIWGRWSDRIGRRPILLISTAGACISYIVFAFACGAQSIWLLLGSRIAAGICGANLSVASAYIADISPPEDRSKRMGLIGVAFGLGFIFLSRSTTGLLSFFFFLLIKSDFSVNSVFDAKPRKMFLLRKSQNGQKKKHYFGTTIS